MLLVLSVLSFSVVCSGQLLGQLADKFLGKTQNVDISKHPNWHLVNSKRCGVENNSDRIIGGQIARFGELPWIVRIGYTGPGLKEISYRCGGAVINENTILTAAHCVTGLPKDFIVAAVQVGEYNTRTDPDCDDSVGCAPPVQVLKPRQIITHSEYNIQPFKHDIALIRVDNMKVDGAWVNPICIINGALTTENFVGQILKVGGWGIYNITDPKNSDDLMVVQLAVQTNDVCQKEYARHAPIGPTQLCVGGTKGKDSCGGDSGGPLMKETNQDGHVRQYVIGIVSFGSKKCGETEMPGIYTRLSSYLDWLLDNIKDNTANYKVIQ